MKQLSPLLVCLLFANLMRAQDPLHIVVIAGEGTINNINQRVNTQPVVEVRDENDKPVEGAAVVFTLPSQGPGGTFSNGTPTMTTTTDRLGRAIAREIAYNQQLGPFYIRVTASYHGQTATATITETNVSGTTNSGRGFSTRAWIILGISAAAVAAAVLFATHHTSSGTSSNGSIVITPGSPTVGGPQ